MTCHVMSFLVGKQCIRAGIPGHSLAEIRRCVRVSVSDGGLGIQHRQRELCTTAPRRKAGVSRHRVPVTCAGRRNPRDDATPESNKAQDLVVQRDILRQVYDSVDLSEIETLLLPQAGDHATAIVRHIDEETALGILCYMADHVKKSQLSIHDDRVCDAIVKTLCDTCVEIDSCSAASLGMLMWVLEILPRQGASWRKSLVVDIAVRECQRNDVGHYSTRELTNIIVSCGRLSGSYFGNEVDRRVMRYIEMLFGELTVRIEKPHVRSAFGGSEFADLADSGALLYEACYAQGNKQGCTACSGFLKNIGAEVKRKLANRHSSSSKAFSAVDLKRFLFSYVKVYMLSPDVGVPDMLDQVASYISGRMKAAEGHSPPYTIQDLAALLEFFAYYETLSLSVLDLFSRAGVQVRLLSASAASKMDDGGAPRVTGPCQDDENTWLAALASILNSHIRLGVRPTDMTLISTLPAIRLLSIHAEPADTVSVIRAFDLFDFDCGETLRKELEPDTSER